MAKTWTAKDPDETLDYEYDWSPDLDLGETIISHVLTPITLAGVTVDQEDQQTSRTVLWVHGGNDGQTASWTLRVTTSAGRILEDTVLLPIVTKVVPDVYGGGYVAPTTANLIAIFPEFGAVSPAQLQYALDRAATSVDQSWSAADFGHARMLLAAHYLTLQGLGTSAAAAAVRSGADQFKSMGIASLSLTRFDKAKAGSWSTTPYGTEFAMLLRRNRGGPRVTGSIARGWGDGDNYGPWTA